MGSSCFWKLELGFWTYTFIHLLGPMWFKSSFLDPRLWGHGIFWDFKILLDSSYDSGVLFVKIGSRFWTYGFICLVDPRRKITYHPLLIDFFHKLISIQVVVCNMLHLHVEELNSCHHYNFMHQWVISYQGQRCWAEQVIWIWHWSNKNIARFTQVKNKGREAWHAILTTQIHFTGSKLSSWLLFS